MGIRKGLKKYLLEKGFCCERGGKTFFQPLGDGFYVCVELHCERRPAYQIEPNHWREIEAPFYDVRFDILCLNERCMEVLKLSLPYMTRQKYLSDVGCLSSLCKICGKQKQDWIKYLRSDETRIQREIIDAFEQEVYIPLFEAKDFSLYDYLCRVALNLGEEISYNSPTLFEAACHERRWKDARYCLRCTIAQRSSLLDAYGYDSVLQHPRSLQQLETYLTDDMIADLVNSEDPYDRYILELYRDIEGRINRP